MRTISRILCPVDFSDASRHAVDHAVVLARWYGSQIVGLHVYQPPVGPLPTYGLGPYGAGAGGGLAAHAVDPLALKAEVDTALRCAVAAGVAAVSRVEMGPTAATIVECAASLPADLIVMGTHGLGGFERLVLGSVTEKVLRKSSVPVLTVPPRPETTSKLPFARLLCPVDFSDASLAALRFASSLAQEGRAELTILHVLEWPEEGDPRASRHFNVPEYLRYCEQDARERLHAIAGEETRDQFVARTTLAHGRAYREILRVAHDERTDLIVMGVHGRHALDLMLLGSTTNQVVRRASCPVLTLR